jgi:hypothetical protein
LSVLVMNIEEGRVDSRIGLIGRAGRVIV